MTQKELTDKLDYASIQYYNGLTSEFSDIEFDLKHSSSDTKSDIKLFAVVDDISNISLNFLLCILLIFLQFLVLDILFTGILGFVSFMLMIKFITVRVDENTVKASEGGEKFNVFKAMANFMKNRPAVGATVAAMGMFIGMQGATTAVTVIFQSYFKNVQISGIVQLFAMIPIVFFTPLARKMVVKYGKKELATFGSICSVVAALGLFIVTPDNTKLDLLMYVGCQLIYSLGLGIYSTVSWAMMGDAIDYNEWKFGAREEGTVYSLHSFFRKLAQGIGPSLVLIVMVALGYVGANEGNQLWEVAVRMRYLVAATFLFSALLQFIGLGLIYNLDKKTMAKMNEELEARRIAE